MFMASQNQPQVSADQPAHFDLTQMLSIQYASRLTPTPNHVLFENSIGQKLKSIGDQAANTNKNFTR